jgi:hypothetical protein
VGGNEEAFEEKEENLQVNQILEIDGKKEKGDELGGGELKVKPHRGEGTWTDGKKFGQSCILCGKKGK